MVLDIEYGREEWRTDPAAAFAEAERRIALTAAAEDPADRETIWFNDLQALEAIPPRLEQVEGLRAIHIGFGKTPDGLVHALGDWPLSDLTALSNVSGLQSLTLSLTKVVDISPLAGIGALESLALNGTQVADIAPLAGMSKIQTLYLGGTKVADIAPLAGMSELRVLHLDASRLVDANRLLDLPWFQHDRGFAPRPAELDIRKTPATEADPELARAADTDNYAVQARRVSRYLRGLDWGDLRGLAWGDEHAAEPRHIADDSRARQVVDAGAVAIAVEDGIARALDRLGPTGPRLPRGGDYTERLDALREEAATVLADASSPERAGQVPAGLVGWLEDFERAARREPPKWFSLRGRARPIRGELQENRKQLQEQVRAGFLSRLEGMLSDLDELAPYLTPPKDIAEEREQLIDDLAALLDDLDGRVGEVLERLEQLEEDFSSMRGREVADESPAEAARVLREEIAAAQASDAPKPRKKRMLAAALASAAGVAGGVGAIAKALRDGEAVGDALQSFLESEAGQGLQTEARELLELIASLFG